MDYCDKDWGVAKQTQIHCWWYISVVPSYQFKIGKWVFWNGCRNRFVFILTDKSTYLNWNWKVYVVGCQSVSLANLCPYFIRTHIDMVFLCQFVSLRNCVKIRTHIDTATICVFHHPKYQSAHLLEIMELDQLYLWRLMHIEVQNDLVTLKHYFMDTIDLKLFA